MSCHNQLQNCNTSFLFVSEDSIIHLSFNCINFVCLSVSLSDVLKQNNQTCVSFSDMRLLFPEENPFTRKMVSDI